MAMKAHLASDNSTQSQQSASKHGLINSSRKKLWLNELVWENHAHPFK